MKRREIIKYKEQLDDFLHHLRLVIWVSIGMSIGMFALAILFLYNHMLFKSILAATLAFLSFRVLREYAVIITKKWLQSRGKYEEMLSFLDEEMKGTSPRQFFSLLERAMKVVDDNE